MLKKDEANRKLLEKRVLLLIGKIETETINNLRNQILTLNLESSSEIRLLIDSKGGNLDQTLFLVDQIQILPAPITAIVNGDCSSAATAILQGCHKRLSTAHSRFLIHFVSCQLDISAYDPKINQKIEEGLKRNRLAHEKLELLYFKRTGLPFEEIKKWMADGENYEKYMSPETAKELNFIDQIIGPDFKLF